MIKFFKKKANKKKVYKVFPNLDGLFKREKSPSDLGYVKIVVSYFQGWLSREDYYKISEIPLETVLNTKETFKKLFVNYFGESEIYILNLNQSIDLIKNDFANIISETIESEIDTVLFDVSQKIIILGFEDLTSIFYFRHDNELTKFMEYVSDIGLNYFLDGNSREIALGNSRDKIE